MFSSIGAVQTGMKIFNLTRNSKTFSSFPSSLVCRYDLYYDNGRVSSSGTNVTTEGAHIYKILDKSGNNYHMISVSSNATPSNIYKSSGLGLAKPCLVCNSSLNGNNATTTGYVTQTTHPMFSNGFEVICVIRPITTAAITQQLLWKHNPAASDPAPFAIDYRRGIGNGISGDKYWNAGVNVRQTLSTAVIMGTRFFKSNSIGYERSNGADVSNSGTLSGYNYTDKDTNPLGLCYRLNISSVWACAYEIGEVLIFNSELTTDVRELMEGYLATKWDIKITNSYYNTDVTYTGANP